MKIVVDRSRCTANGFCEAIAPQHFSLNEDGELTVLNEDVSPADQAQVEDAVSSCPAAALRLDKS
jgi:ferredoxin